MMSTKITLCSPSGWAIPGTIVDIAGERFKILRIDSQGAVWIRRTFWSWLRTFFGRETSADRVIERLAKYPDTDDHEFNRVCSSDKSCSICHR